MTATYDYLTMTLRRGRPAWRDFARGAAEAAHHVRNAGGDLVGVFSPQLGFASNEAAALLRRPDEPGASGVLTDLPEVVTFDSQTLTPTARPSDERGLRSDGIYVHRWFTIDGDGVDAFVDISARAWAGFEAAYDVEIFGLFRAALTAEDRAAGQARLLLMTWYASHGVWEASREQTVDPDGLFTKRHEMTRSTVGRSSLRVAL